MAGGNNYGARLDNRQRGNATQLLEKYRALARDAQQAGDRVTAEYYLQYAEHYFRILGDYRDRQPEGRRGRDGYDDDGLDGDTETAEGDAGDERDDGDDDRRDSRRDERPRDDRQRDDRSRGDRNRDDRPRDDRPRNDRSRDDRPRDDRPRDDRGGDRNRRDWQRDRRPERSDQSREPDGAEAPVADERESLLQALPPPVSRSEGRRLGLRREPVEAGAADVPAPAPASTDAADEAAPGRRTRARKPATQAESAD